MVSEVTSMAFRPFCHLYTVEEDCAIGREYVFFRIFSGVTTK
jgi:hypothetical protein